MDFKRPQSLDLPGFAVLCAVQLFSQLLGEHARQFIDCRYCAKLLGMGVAVHGGLNIRVAHDNLQILYICVRGGKRREGMAEHMSSGD